jgi:hypothetical protein
MSKRMLFVGIGIALVAGATAYIWSQRPSPKLVPAGNDAAGVESPDKFLPTDSTPKPAEQMEEPAEESEEAVLADRPAQATDGAPAAELPEAETVIPTEKKAEKPAPHAPVAKTPPKPLLKDWPTPAAAFVLSGEMHGYVEPCGCSLNQLGGLSRRADLFRQIKDRGWPVTALDTGGLVANAGRRQAKVKLRMAFDALRELHYAGIAMGVEEAQTGIDLLLFDEKDRPPLLSCNLVIGGGDIGTHIPKTMATVGKLKVGVTAVLGDTLAAKVASQNAGEIQVQRAVESLEKVVAELEAEKPDLLVLLSHAKLAESKKLAEKFPQFQLIVSAGGPEDPDPQPQYVGETLVVAPGQKGKHVAVVGYYPDEAGKKFRYESVALDGERFQETPSMREHMRRYQEALAVQELVSSEPRFDDPRNTTRMIEDNPFVGSKVCGECHTKAYKKWLSTGHAKATQSIKTGRKGEEAKFISRINDPECVACHVTGWETGRENQEGPKDYYGFKSGFVSEQATLHLTGQGCENCHGPGGRHTELERQFAKDAKQSDALTQFRDFLHLQVDGIGAKLCVKCHDGDNDPHFKTDGDVFEEFWSKIIHLGVD